MGGGEGVLQISKQLSNHMKGCQNKRNKEKICNVTKAEGSRKIGGGGGDYFLFILNLRLSKKKEVFQ